MWRRPESRLSVADAVHGHAGVEEAECVSFDDGVEGDALRVEVGVGGAEGGGSGGEEPLAGAGSGGEKELAFAENDAGGSFFGIVIHVAAGVGSVVGGRVEFFGSPVGGVSVPVRAVDEFGDSARGTAEDEYRFGKVSRGGAEGIGLEPEEWGGSAVVFDREALRCGDEFERLRGGCESAGVVGGVGHDGGVGGRCRRVGERLIAEGGFDGVDGELDDGPVETSVAHGDDAEAVVHVHFKEGGEAGDAAAMLDDGVAAFLAHDEAVGVVVEGGLGELREGCFGEDAARGRGTAVKDHAGVREHVGGGGGVAAVGGEVFEPGLLDEVAGVGPAAVTRGERGAKGVVDGGVGGTHAEWIEDAAAGDGGVTVVIDVLEDVAEDLEAEVGIPVMLAGCVGRLEVADGEGGEGDGGEVGAIVLEAGGVSEEVVDGDGAVFGFDCEPGQVFGEGGLRIEAAFVVELHEADGGEGLGDGSDVEEGVGSDAGFGFEVGESIGADFEGVSAVGDADDHSGLCGGSCGGAVDGFECAGESGVGGGLRVGGCEREEDEGEDEPHG